MKTRQFLPQRLITFIFLIVSLFVWQSLPADTVYLKNGRKQTGKIVGQSRKIIRLRLANGKTVVIPKTGVRRIKFDKSGSKAEAEKKRKAALLRKKQAKKRKADLLKKKKAAELKKKKATELKKLTQQKEQELTRLKKEAEQRKKVVNNKNQNQITPNLTATDALWRSALIPGWGQWQRGEKLKGGLFAGGTLLTGIALYETNRIYQNTARDLNAMSNPFAENTMLLAAAGISITPTAKQFLDPILFTIYDQSFINQRAKFDKQQNQTRYAKVGLLLVYGWNLIDAWFFPPEQTVKQSGESKGVARRPNSWSIYPAITVDDYTDFGSSKKFGSNLNFRQELHFSKRVEF